MSFFSKEKKEKKKKKNSRLLFSSLSLSPFSPFSLSLSLSLSLLLLPLRYDNYRGNADACITAMGLSFPPARFVANVTSTASELLRGARKQLQAKKAALGLGGGRFQLSSQQSQGGASVGSNVNSAAAATAAATAASAGPAISQEGEVEAGLAKALVLHTPTDVFVIFRGTMSRRDFDHINLVVYPVEAGAFYGAQGGEKVFVVRRGGERGGDGEEEKAQKGKKKKGKSLSLITHSLTLDDDDKKN